MESYEFLQRKNRLAAQSGKLALEFVGRDRKVPGVEIGLCDAVINQDRPAEDRSPNDAPRDALCDPDKLCSHTRTISASPDKLLAIRGRGGRCARNIDKDFTRDNAAIQGWLA